MSEKVIAFTDEELEQIGIALAIRVQGLSDILRAGRADNSEARRKRDLTRAALHKVYHVLSPPLRSHVDLLAPPGDRKP